MKEKKNDNDQVAQKHRHSVKRKKRRYQRNKSVVERLCRTDSFFFSPTYSVNETHKTQTLTSLSHLRVLSFQIQHQCCATFVKIILHAQHSSKMIRGTKASAHTCVLRLLPRPPQKKKKTIVKTQEKGKKVQNRIQNFPGASPNLHASSHQQQATMC